MALREGAKEKPCAVPARAHPSETRTPFSFAGRAFNLANAVAWFGALGRDAHSRHDVRAGVTRWNFPDRGTILGSERNAGFPGNRVRGPATGPRGVSRWVTERRFSGVDAGSRPAPRGPSYCPMRGLPWHSGCGDDCGNSGSATPLRGAAHQATPGPPSPAHSAPRSPARPLRLPGKGLRLSRATPVPSGSHPSGLSRTVRPQIARLHPRPD